MAAISCSNYVIDIQTCRPVLALRSTASKRRAKRGKKASAGQKEVLMPIAGKKPAKEAAAKKPATGARRKSA